MSRIFPGVRKKILAGCHEGNPPVRKNGFRLKFVWKKIFLSIALVQWENDFCLLKKNGQSVTKSIYVFMGTVWWNFFSKNSCFSIVFGHLDILFRIFADCFSKRLSELLFICPKEHFEAIIFWKNLFFLYLQRAKNFWHFVVEFFSVVWNTAINVSGGTIWGRIYLLFWKKSCFFSLSYIEDSFAASGKSFLAVLSQMHSTCP